MIARAGYICAAAKSIGYPHPDFNLNRE